MDEDKEVDSNCNGIKVRTEVQHSVIKVKSLENLPYAMWAK